jgi:hypothetical protein
MTPQSLARKVLLGLLGLASCALLVLVLLPYIVSLDSVKDQIVGQIEAALQRKVDVSAVRLQLLSGLGVGLEQLTIHNPPGWQQPHLLKAATLSVKVAWRPLMRRHIVITKMILRDGEILIERDPQGRLNSADLAASTPAAPDKTQPSRLHRSANGQAVRSGFTPLAGLRVSEVTVQNMPITFVDRMVVPSQEIITTVSNFQLHLQDVALGRLIPVDMTATLLTDGSRNVHLRGSVGPIPELSSINSAPVDIKLQTTDVRLDKLTPYLGQEFPLVQGRVGGDVTLQGSLASGLHLIGKLSLADAVLQAGIVSDATTALPMLTSTQDITLDLATGRADLTDVALNMSGIQATITGALHTFTTTPQFDLQLATNVFTPVALLTDLPILASKLPAPADVRGNVQLQATVKGALHDFRSEALIDLREAVVRSGAFNGGAPGDGGLLLETDKAEARLATHVVKADPPHLHFEARAHRLVFDQQGPHSPAPTPNTQSTPTPQTAPSKPLLPPVTLTGKVAIAEGRLKTLTFQQMTTQLSLSDGALNTTQHLTLYGGSYQGTVQVNLTQSEPSYTLDATVTGLDVGQALRELTPDQNALLGVLDTDMHLSGRGLAWDVLNKTLSGNGHVKITEAQLTNFDLIPKLALVLQNVGGLVGLTLPSGWEDNTFRTIEGDWRLRHGRILTDHLRLRAEGMEALITGSVGLDRTLDYTGNLFLPAQFFVRREAPRLLRQDDAGRVIIPFTVKGVVDAPRITVDEKALVGGAKQELLDTVRKQLGGKLDELFGQPSAPDQSNQESEQTGPKPGDEAPQPRWPGKILQEILRR